MNLITSFFPRSIPASLASSLMSFPWLDVLGASQQRDPCIFLALFKKLAAVSKEVFEKFTKAADNNESFSRLLEKTLSSSHSVALSLDETFNLRLVSVG